LTNPQSDSTVAGRPILSVAIATRNYGRYLPRSLGSALRAGRMLGLPFEIVVVDDASIDDTRAILERFRLDHPQRIRVVYRSTTRGIAVAKNTALGHCAGVYVALLDADDEFHPEKLARCYARIAGGNTDIVTHDFIDWRGPAEHYVKDRVTWPWGDFWPPSTWVFRNGLVRFNQQLIGSGEDLEWLLRRRRNLRRRHVAIPLNIQYAHANSVGKSSDCLVPARQLMSRLQGRAHPDDHRAPKIWACADCGRQYLLPAVCCGCPTAFTPLLYYSMVESPSPPAAPPEFSFVFLTKNQAAGTQRTVDNLLAQLGDTRAELIFVDGSSTDGTLDAIRRWAASLQVKLVCVPPEEPSNFSRSANRGARAATGTFLIFVNHDVTVCSHRLPAALRDALSDPRVGAVDISPAWNEAHCDPAWDTERSPYVFTSRPLAGFFWGCRRAVYWELGGMEEAFTSYGHEELDFQYRALQAHYRLALVPGQVAHQGSGTFAAVYPAVSKRTMEHVNHTVFEEKHGWSIYALGNRSELFARYAPPELSVVIVAQDVGRALRRTLELTASEQWCHDGSVQVVVVNNGSQDETGLVLAEYRRRLPRLLSVIELPRPVESHDALSVGQARAIGRVLRSQPAGERLNIQRNP
jgi:glycosyltransferase involved in cell wall biosynthesis